MCQRDDDVGGVHDDRLLPAVAPQASGYRVDGFRRDDAGVVLVGFQIGDFAEQ